MALGPQLQGELLFEPGKSELRPESLLLLEELASLIGDVEEQVSVEGHSDSQPGGQGTDNWEISTGRAIADGEFAPVPRPRNSPVVTVECDPLELITYGGRRSCRCRNHCH